MASLHFTGTTPDQVDPQLFSDIESANSLDISHVEPLVEQLLGFLTKGGDLMTSLEEFTTQYGANPSSLKSVVRGLLYLLKGAQKCQLSPTRLQEDLATLGASEPVATAVVTKWKEYLGSLCKVMIDQTIAVNQLVDMEWVFGVTAANSDVNQVGNTFLKLKLVLKKGDSTEDIYMELSLPQFYDFLADMERARKQLDYLT